MMNYLKTMNSNVLLTMLWVALMTSFALPSSDIETKIQEMQTNVQDVFESPSMSNTEKDTAYTQFAKEVKVLLKQIKDLPQEHELSDQLLALQKLIKDYQSKLKQGFFSRNKWRLLAGGAATLALITALIHRHRSAVAAELRAQEAVALAEQKAAEQKANELAEQKANEQKAKDLAAQQAQKIADDLKEEQERNAREDQKEKDRVAAQAVLDAQLAADRKKQAKDDDAAIHKLIEQRTQDDKPSVPQSYIDWANNNYQHIGFRNYLDSLNTAEKAALTKIQELTGIGESWWSIKNVLSNPSAYGITAKIFTDQLVPNMQILLDAKERIDKYKSDNDPDTICREIGYHLSRFDNWNTFQDDLTLCSDQEKEALVRLRNHIVDPEDIIRADKRNSFGIVQMEHTFSYNNRNKSATELRKIRDDLNSSIKVIDRLKKQHKELRNVESYKEFSALLRDPQKFYDEYLSYQLKDVAMNNEEAAAKKVLEGICEGHWRYLLSALEDFNKTSSAQLKANVLPAIETMLQFKKRVDSERLIKKAAYDTAINAFKANAAVRQINQVFFKDALFRNTAYHTDKPSNDPAQLNNITFILGKHPQVLSSNELAAFNELNQLRIVKNKPLEYERVDFNSWHREFIPLQWTDTQLNRCTPQEITRIQELMTALSGVPVKIEKQRGEMFKQISQSEAFTQFEKWEKAEAVSQKFSLKVGKMLILDNKINDWKKLLGGHPNALLCDTIKTFKDKVPNLTCVQIDALKNDIEDVVNTLAEKERAQKVEQELAEFKKLIDIKHAPTPLFSVYMAPEEVKGRSFFGSGDAYDSYDRALNSMTDEIGRNLLQKYRPTGIACFEKSKCDCLEVCHKEKLDPFLSQDVIRKMLGYYAQTAVQIYQTRPASQRTQTITAQQIEDRLRADIKSVFDRYLKLTMGNHDQARTQFHTEFAAQVENEKSLSTPAMQQCVKELVPLTLFGTLDKVTAGIDGILAKYKLDQMDTTQRGNLKKVYGSIVRSYQSRSFATEGCDERLKVINQKIDAVSSTTSPASTSTPASSTV